MDEWKPLNVGIFDVSSNLFSTVATGVTSSYSGGAAVGSRIIFAPDGQKDVGVHDTTDNTFTTFASSEEGYTAGAYIRPLFSST